MSTVYTKRLASGRLAGGMQTFTVPAGKTWIVICLDANVDSVVNNAATIYMGRGQNEVWFVRTVTATGGQSIQWTGHQAFSAGESLVVGQPAGTWDYAITGYELTN
jgi:hypothetical protein